MFRNMRLLGDIFNLFPLLGSRHLMCDFQNGKIQLDCRLGRFCREVVADERGQLMSRLRQLGRLFRAPVLQRLPGLHILHHRPNLGVSFDDGQRRLNRSRTQ